MSLLYALLGLLCWAVSKVQGCVKCELSHCLKCSCDGTICETCDYGYALSYHEDSCFLDYSSPYSSRYGTSPSTHDDEEDDNRGSFVGVLLVTVFLFSVIYAIVRCRLRQLETTYAPYPDPYIPHRFQRVNLSPAPPPFVPYSGQAWYAEPGPSRGPPTYTNFPNEPTSTSSDSSNERPRETAYVVGPDGELQVGIGK